ncbi:hypothetical protein HNR44_000234 [Geomicrobium halophilum]|uniref:DUF4363 domain-containing protein n=1 Tax=Geomicrobium halophilum TaxID=549000 RepID=A0A841PWP0_9BACL|nr:DUF4363 family protein [Geomicrobium halophilum]MBB6448285.1 hypothetical protein [Geomicrobium halophilum]
MKKFLLFSVPSLFLILSVVLMTGGSWIKEPMGAHDDLFSYVQNIEHFIEEENWEEASEEHQNAQQAWDTISKRIQYSVEREDMLAISETLSRIEGGIKEEDTSSISPELYYFYELWSELG